MSIPGRQAIAIVVAEWSICGSTHHYPAVNPCGPAECGGRLVLHVILAPQRRLGTSHWPLVEQVNMPAQVPHEYPQPSGSQFLLTQLGMQGALVVGAIVVVVAGAAVVVVVRAAVVVVAGAAVVVVVGAAVVVVVGAAVVVVAGAAVVVVIGAMVVVVAGAEVVVVVAGAGVVVVTGAMVVVVAGGSVVVVGQPGPTSWHEL
ncbi:hypothetical protein BH23CHL5_BH23CHL5_19660 [soil metagenome]